LELTIYQNFHQTERVLAGEPVLVLEPPVVVAVVAVAPVAVVAEAVVAVVTGAEVAVPVHTIEVARVVSPPSSRKSE